MLALAFGLASASVAGLLRLPWLDIGTAGLIGLLVGVVDWVSATRPRLREANEAISALLAATVANLVAKFVGPPKTNTVEIGGWRGREGVASDRGVCVGVEQGGWRRKKKK